MTPELTERLRRAKVDQRVLLEWAMNGWIVVRVKRAYRRRKKQNAQLG